MRRVIRLAAGVGCAWSLVCPVWSCTCLESSLGALGAGLRCALDGTGHSASASTTASTVLSLSKALIRPLALP
jgi:hypothetical protein